MGKEQDMNSLKGINEILKAHKEDLYRERETLRVEGKRAVDSKLPLFGLQR